MATVTWTPNAITTTQVITYTLTAVAVGSAFTATLNSKVITYTVVTGDTTTTAAAALTALLTAAAGIQGNEEFGLATYASSANVITATSATPGTPFAGMTGGLVFAATGGNTGTGATVTANSSPSDVNNAKNWLRSGSQAIPQNGDAVVAQDTDIPMLWNLDALAAVTFLSWTRYQSMTGQIGLPTLNQAGFIEFRATYFQFSGSATALPLILGVGAGDGPPFERYNTGSKRTDLYVSAGTQVDFLGTSVSNTISASGVMVNVATEVPAVATISTALVDGGGTINLGAGVTFSGTLTLKNAAATVECAATIAANSSTVTLTGTGVTYTAFTGVLSQLSLLTDATITTLTISNNTTVDKSQDLRAMVVTNWSLDGTCQILDPNSRITFTNPGTWTGPVQAGPLQFLGNRTIAVS